MKTLGIVHRVGEQVYSEFRRFVWMFQNAIQWN